VLNSGQILLLISVALSGICSVLSIRGEYLKRSRQVFLLTNLSFIFLFAAFCFLASRYITSDFSYINVFQNSNSLKPLLYKITGLWGNHEGSMLLFLMILNIYTFCFCNFSNYKNKIFALTVQNFLGFLIGIYIFFVSDPFLQFSNNIPLEGAGLNPLLQDVGLASHPPLLYLGYAGFSLAFSIAITAINLKEEGVEWALEIKFWSLISFAFLSLGVMLGSWWAYRELGWGGFWFWDPVENSSLLPWLVGLALIHSLLSTKKFELLKNLTLCLAVASFLASIFGFFIVRSGVLSSVHSFASDPSRGIFMLVIMVLICLTGFYNLIFKGMASKTAPIELGLISRYGLILMNILLLVILSFTLILAILYPLILDFTSQHKITIGEPYFNLVYIPISLLMAFIMVYTPFIKWPRENILPPLKKSSISFLFSLIITCTIKYLYPEQLTLRPFFGTLFGLWLITSLLWLLITRFFKKEKISKGFFAMAVSHIGFGILLLSISLKVSFEQEKHHIFKLDKKLDFAGYEIKLKSYNIGKASNYFFQSADFLAISDDGKRAILSPENRVYMPKLTKTHESDILSKFFSDFYIVLGESEKTEKGEVLFPAKIYYRPFISLIWLSAVIIALGAIISVLPSRKNI